MKGVKLSSRSTMIQPTPPKKNSSAENLEAIVLAGGLGTRLRSVVSDRQKVVAPVNGTPALETIIKKLFDEGISRIILCVGYLKETVVKTIKEAASRDPRFLAVEFSEEDTPLGTGGAIKLAAERLRNEMCLVLNGDTLSEVKLVEFSKFHNDKKNDISIAITKEIEGDGGRISIDNSGRILSFSEKAGDGEFINAGVYIINRRVFNLMPKGVFSIENEFFPKAIKIMNCGAFVTKRFIDIGTPERYELANKTFLPYSGDRP